MQKILYFDSASFFIFIVLLATISMKGLTRGRLNRYFMYVVVTATLAAVFDTLSIAYDNLEGRYGVTQYFCHSMYLFWHGLSTPLYAVFVINHVDAWYKFRNKVLRVLLVVPFIINTALLVVNLFYPCVFTIDEGGHYGREAGMIYTYVMAAFYMAIGFVVVVKYRYRISKRRFVSIIAIFPIVLSATVVQVFRPQMPIEMFADALGLLFAALMIQSPEMMVSSSTGLSKMTVYMDDVKNALENGRDIRIIMINMENNRTLRDMLGVVEYHRLLRVFAEKLELAVKERRLQAELYYLNDGMFRCIFDYRSMEHACELAELINAEFSDGFCFNDVVLNIRLNICITDCPQDIDNVNDIMRFGPELSKHSYTGQLMYAKDIFVREKYDLMRDMDVVIEKAMTTGGLSVYYQPIYSVSEKRYKSAEALIRLKDDKYGFVPPDIFIPAAEQNGMIHKIGRFVLSEVCRFIAGDEFKASGLECIEVNLSVMQCMSTTLADEVREVMDRFGVRPGQINLEITETAAAYAQATMMDNINSLTDSGIAFSLDDFGTGYSNMKRIALMPFEIVKLDKTFTEMSTSEKMRLVVKNTIIMVKDMNLKIVVEGVETEDMAKDFSELGVDYIQGYYYSRPLPLQDFLEEVRRVNTAVK